MWFKVKKQEFDFKVINGIQVNTILSEKALTYRFLTETGHIQTVDKETGKVLKSEIDKRICDPSDLI
ncbi:hypothetical protein ACFDD0_13050 [Enterococcus lactis]|uniref:hypothetical protein n=1 Tax=Enterococcus lactis TaxID=357441 RepID=UPI001895E8F0